MNPYGLNKRERTSLRAAIFEAYFDCRRHKRGTCNALRFELNLEQEVQSLYQDIVSGKYVIGRSCAFIVYKPAQREIFAADFRDRVVHHYIINKLEPIFERLFIYDSYSCRKGKGTHFGASRVAGFIRSCSQNYKQDCYVLKVDIQGFFMNIRKDLLIEKLETIILKHYKGFDKELLLAITRQVVSYNPVPNCVIKGSTDDWQGLPESKSLFRTEGRDGLPIGNLTSQVFANVYLNDFDQYVKRELKMQYYGRYVDDCVFVHSSKEHLKDVKQKIGDYLSSKLGLTLHPKKHYLQHYTKGVQFVGVFIKPYRQYVGRRIQKNMNRTFVNDYRTVFANNENEYSENLKHWLSSANSYLGICKHYNTYRYRQQLCKYLDGNPVGIHFNEAYEIAKIDTLM